MYKGSHLLSGRVYFWKLLTLSAAYIFVVFIDVPWICDFGFHLRGLKSSSVDLMYYNLGNKLTGLWQSCAWNAKVTTDKEDVMVIFNWYFKLNISTDGVIGQRLMCSFQLEWESIVTLALFCALLSGEEAARAFLNFFATWLAYVVVTKETVGALPDLTHCEAWLDTQGNKYRVSDYQLGHSTWSEVAMAMLGAKNVSKLTMM